MYGVELPIIKPWTSRPVVIDAVLKLVDSASNVATDSGASSSASAKDVIDLLPEFATLLFACVQERLDWLGRLVVGCHGRCMQGVGTDSREQSNGC